MTPAVVKKREVLAYPGYAFRVDVGGDDGLIGLRPGQLRAKWIQYQGTAGEFMASTPAHAVDASHITLVFYCPGL